MGRKGPLFTPDGSVDWWSPIEISVEASDKNKLELPVDLTLSCQGTLPRDSKFYHEARKITQLAKTHGLTIPRPSGGNDTIKVHKRSSECPICTMAPAYICTHIESTHTNDILNIFLKNASESYHIGNCISMCVYSQYQGNGMSLDVHQHIHG